MKTTCRNTSPRFSFLSSSFHIARLPSELFHTAIITRVRFTPISNETHCFFFFSLIVVVVVVVVYSLLLLFPLSKIQFSSQQAKKSNE